MDELQRKLRRFQKNLDELSRTTNVSFDDLFTPSFMDKYTNFSSFEGLLTAGGFIVQSQEDFEAIPEDVFDVHISKHTKFKNWKEMLGKAGEEYIARKLTF